VYLFISMPINLSRSHKLRLFSFLVCFLSVGCTLFSAPEDPAQESKSIRLLSESQMNSMGESTFREIKAKTKISSNRLLKAKIERIGRRLATVSGKSYNWEFELFDEPKTVNAFCLPGGKIGVYTGIIPVAENEAGLAAVLGHEIAHAILGHGNERVSRGLITSIGLAAFEAALGDSRHRNVIIAGLGIGAQFGIELPFSRSHESAADRVGTLYMARAGYDPRQASTLWVRMAKSSGQGPEFMSTHPDPLRRSRDLDSQMEEFNKEYQNSEKQLAGSL
jgi:predicted Zn-dependent protease